MDNSKFRIAIASSDGIVVNNHFGHAKQFYIYEWQGETLSFVELRKVTPVCEGGNHDEKRLEENVKVIEDCDALLVSKIGIGAARVVEQYGIEPYELPGVISESVEQLVKFLQIKQLFI